jgi:2-polyprenyl-6-hydroxyphenyl methylase/3-demethylubiquinone-9 3-methyltransferase
MASIVLKTASLEPVPCKICGAPAHPFGAVDFNKSCDEPRAEKLPPLGIPVPFRRCANCGFLFTECFDDWADHDFKQFIYNDDYIKLDPDYVDRRPRLNANMLCTQFQADRAVLRMLDYGSGNGLLSRCLREAGFTTVESFDPFTPTFSHRPVGRFDVVTCFETMEHLTDPLAKIDDMVGLLSEIGVVIFSTLVQPADFESIGLSWWYVGPRNGHVSLFTREALAIAWRRHGFTVVSFNENTHLAFRNSP